MPDSVPIRDEIKVIGSRMSMLEVFDWAEVAHPSIGGRIQVA